MIPAPADARFFALIPCAGSGSRAATSQPKQYQPVAGRALVAHTLAAFAQVSHITQVLVVTAPGDTFFDGADQHSVAVAGCGGATRAESVHNGLMALLAHGARRADWVLVHDAARCLITAEQIVRLIEACRDDDVGGLLAQPVADTLKSSADGRVAATLARDDKWLAQTPQMFRVGVLLEALAHAFQSGTDVTDEASAIEAVGLQPRLVRGSAQNFKVTYPEDFALAAAVLETRAQRL